ncbi:uncharacterized protein BJ171DRAFT_504139 [Polychytrium aggregatum]|uniref:uncharacterized protein n=1 Tax=Polychytrium aggregatum TaxID=110093 RepID=UPI0022FE309A|nr:uncharacterized protein BJ171DRAFT_504139 [Polychytrium aggregatum]KAI9204941.1 hypothetical protein BJ171DRAFT_504139 [Polychytrium aggregatum]
MVSQAPKVPVCATCGEVGHAKSSSSLCTKKNPLWSSTLPGCGPNEQVKADYSTVKCTLDAIIKNDALHDKIEETVRAMTQVQYEASRLLELHLRRCLDEGITLPTVSSSEPAFVRKCFNMVQTGTYMEWIVYPASSVPPKGHWLTGPWFGCQDLCSQLRDTRSRSVLVSPPSILQPGPDCSQGM